MVHTTSFGLFRLMLAFVALTMLMETSHAYSSYGNAVDSACQAFNGTTPYASQSCALCHTSTRSQRVDPAWTWYQSGNLTAFCPVATNRAPVANAGVNQSLSAGATVTLNGSASSDPDGNPLTYLWSLTSVPTGSVATLNSTTAIRPTFVADKAGSYVARLIVNDGKVSSAASTVTITAVAVNLSPAMPRNFRIQ